jgi:SOS response regulatory protein OraA/RecX
MAERLTRASVAPAVVEESLAVLSRAGLVDDARFAGTRAARLAERGYGDAAIRHDLEGQGIGPEPIQQALGSLEAEAERARRLVERRGPGVRTARYLAAKGFGEEALGAAAGADFAPDP